MNCKQQRRVDLIQKYLYISLMIKTEAGSAKETAFME